MEQRSFQQPQLDVEDLDYPFGNNREGQSGNPFNRKKNNDNDTAKQKSHTSLPSLFSGVASLKYYMLT
eukprot:gene7381-5195_t